MASPLEDRGEAESEPPLQGLLEMPHCDRLKHPGGQRCEAFSLRDTSTKRKRVGPLRIYTSTKRKRVGPLRIYTSTKRKRVGPLRIYTSTKSQASAAIVRRIH